MIGDKLIRPHDLDGVARQLVQRAYEVITQRFGWEPNTLESKFIYEAYLRIKEILVTSETISSPSQDAETILASNLVMCLYMLLIVWVKEREITHEIIPQLKEIVSEVLADVSW
jgi:hypothetical protein